MALPTYAFDRSRFWPTAVTGQGDTEETPSGVDSAFWAAVEREDLAALAELTEQDAAESLERLGAALPVLASWRRQQRNRSSLDDLRYRSVWQPYTGTPVSFLPGAWWVVADERHPEEGEAAVVELTRRGADVRLVLVPENLTDRAALTAHLSGAVRTADGVPAPVDGVLSLLALADGAVDDTQPVPPFLARSLALIQALGDLDVAAPLWCVTRGAAGTTRSGARRPAGAVAALGPRPGRGPRTPRAVGRPGRRAGHPGRPRLGPALRRARRPRRRGPARGRRRHHPRPPAGAGARR